MGRAEGSAPVAHARKYWPLMHAGEPFTDPGVTAEAPVLQPFVSVGRWVVVCPGCASSNRASRDDPRFMCIECGNKTTGGAWLPAPWPAEADQIELLLGARGIRQTRNWRSPETVADLAAENIEHGIAV